MIDLVHFYVKRHILSRMKDIEFYMKNPMASQYLVFKCLIGNSINTQFGRDHNFDQIDTIKKFQEKVPIRTYEDYYPYIEKILRGEKNITYRGRVNWFAKSSGTTNDKSKFIPITNDNLQGCHFESGRDLLALFFNQKKDSKLLKGKCLTMGGSHQITPLNKHARQGDLSAVLIENLPWIFQIQRAPKKSTALLANYEEKLALMLNETINENITSIAGVPTWTLILIQNLIKKKGVKNLQEIWPNLEVFFHGGVSFKPYRNQFEEFYPSNDMNYMETYNASEGFFGIQNDFKTRDLLLLLNRGIFYEFVPIEEIQNENPPSLTIEEVELDKVYAMIISTTSGLWRYNIGDTVKFTSKFPHKIVISGRTKHFINAFGEELMIDNAEIALEKAMELTGAKITDYTAAPIYFNHGKPGGHEWLIEFETPPCSMEMFQTIFDQTLKDINSDYEAKRYHDIAMSAPVIRSLPVSTFYNWMKSRGKLGGQNKAPRLSNDRIYVDSILSFCNLECIELPQSEEL